MGLETGQKSMVHWQKCQLVSLEWISVVPDLHHNDLVELGHRRHAADYRLG